MIDYIAQTFRDWTKPPVLPEGVKPDPSWKLVKYRSIHCTVQKYGYLTPKGDAMIYLDWIVPLGDDDKWRVASSKDEIAEILEYINPSTSANETNQK